MTPAEKQAFDLMRDALEKHGSAPLDWACVKCRPESHCLKKDFLCLFHFALAAADAVAEQVTHGPQPMPDLTTLHANGAKAWAGVNAQDLREGKPVGEPPADQLPDARKMAAALRAIADGTVMTGDNTSHFATVLAYQTLARQAMETDAERMAGAREKMIDDYSSDILARMEDDPR